MSKINWQGYEWLTQERWGNVHPENPTKWNDPSAIKIDVEGYEKKVLTGLENVISNFKPAIIFELNEPTREELKNQKMQDLFGKEYSFYGITRGRENPKLTPLNLEKKYENILAITSDDLTALVNTNKKMKGLMSIKY